MDEDEDDSDALAEIERQKMFAAAGWTAADECAFTREIAKPDGLDCVHLALDVVETAELIRTKVYVDNDTNNFRARVKRRRKARIKLRNLVKSQDA